MSESGDSRRSYGSGSLFVHRGSWYGKWRIGPRQVKRKVGSKRKPGSRDGLTKAQAEEELRRLMREVMATPQERLTLEEVGNAYVANVRDVLERKPATIQDYESILRGAVRLFPKKTVERFEPGDVTAYIATQKKAGRAPKTISNHLIFLHGLFAFAVKRGWTIRNVVAETDRPRSEGVDPDIRHIDQAELDALIAAVPDDTLGQIEPALYLTAAMCGLRQGELVALRWQDVDWNAKLIRVRRNFTRGRFGTPKSRRSSRAVPMPAKVAAALRQRFKTSQFTGDTDLVFCHPETGAPYDASKLRKRFKDAVKAAGIRPIRFHDLRHTFGTRMVAAGAPLRNIQEWMGHRDYKTTLIYADYAPDPAQGARWAEAAFPEAEEDDERDLDESTDQAA
jgi:integrase